MKAILMAAGRGTRISRAINDDCKCTLDIGGISLIRYTTEMLINHGIDVHIVIGYDKERIKNALAGLQVTFHENVFYSITNSLVSLWCAREELFGEQIVLGNADVYWEENLLAVLANEKRDCVLLSDTSRVEQGDYLLSVVDGKIVSYGKGNDCSNPNCEYVGLAIIRGAMIPRFKARLETLVEQQKHDSWWESVLYSMIRERPIWSKDIAGCFWAEIDYIEDYKRILEYRKGMQ